MKQLFYYFSPHLIEHYNFIENIVKTTEQNKHHLERETNLNSNVLIHMKSGTLIFVNGTYYLAKHQNRFHEVINSDFNTFKQKCFIAINGLYTGDS